MHLRLEKAGFAYDKSLPPPENFGNAIESLSAANGGRGIVILIDEYDAPVGHALGDIDMAEAIHDRMSALYSRMKNRTGDIRFLLMTGISKFTRLRIGRTVAPSGSSGCPLTRKQGFSSTSPQNRFEHRRSTRRSLPRLCMCLHPLAGQSYKKRF